MEPTEHYIIQTMYWNTPQGPQQVAGPIVLPVEIEAPHPNKPVILKGNSVKDHDGTRYRDDKGVDNVLV